MNVNPVLIFFCFKACFSLILKFSLSMYDSRTHWNSYPSKSMRTYVFELANKIQLAVLFRSFGGYHETFIFNCTQCHEPGQKKIHHFLFTDNCAVINRSFKCPQKYNEPFQWVFNFIYWDKSTSNIYSDVLSSLTTDIVIFQYFKNQNKVYV